MRKKSFMFPVGNYIMLIDAVTLEEVKNLLQSGEVFYQENAVKQANELGYDIVEFDDVAIDGWAKNYFCMHVRSYFNDDFKRKFLTWADSVYWNTDAKSHLLRDKETDFPAVFPWTGEEGLSALNKVILEFDGENGINRIETTWVLIEETEGDLHFFSFNSNQNIINSITNLSSKQAREELALFLSKKTTETMVSCVKYPQQFYESFTAEDRQLGKWQIVAEGNFSGGKACGLSIYTKRMKGSARSVFEPKAWIGERIRTWRDVKNITQIQLARLIDSAAPVISGYEAGKKEMGITQFLRILHALQLDPKDLVEGL